MRPHRVMSIAGVVTLGIAIAACGGSSPGASSDSSQAEQSTAASQAEQSAAESSGGLSNDDVTAIANSLVPPNSSQLSQTNAQGTIWTAYDSTDSVDSLKSFYENAIPQTGMQIFSTTSADGSYSWVFAQNDSSSYGGSVTLGPASDGSNGSSVIVIVTNGN